MSRIKLGDFLNLAELQSLDAAARVLQKLAKAAEVDFAEMAVRPDGRVEFIGEDGGRLNWVVRADLHPDSSDPLPSAALQNCLVRKVDTGRGGEGT